MVKRLIVVTDQGTAKAFGELFDKIIYRPTEVLSKNDVVLFEGGTDVSPAYYGEELGKYSQFPDLDRDQRERIFFKWAKKSGAACIGVCRGSQFLTVMNGGKLIQHVTGHGGTHNAITSSGYLRVTSTHHQMMYPFDLPEEDWTILAWAAPRLSKCYLNGNNKESVEPPLEPEIVWYPRSRSLAIQGHPEYVGKDDPFPVYCRELVKKYIFGESN